MRMKRVISYLSIPFLLLAASCAEKVEIEFPHEQRAFDTRSNMILVEGIMPQASTASEEIYIIGAFNGGEAAIGNPDYLMTHSEAIPSKWGIYLDPSRFQGGKDLADGFTFYSVQQGQERSPKNEEVRHRLNIGVGEWANVYVDKWAKYFAPPENPDEVKLPEHDGVRIYIIDQTGWDAIALYQWGDVNNFGGDWPGAQVAGTWTCNGVEYKYFEYGDDIFGLGQNLIFNNNNNGSQLADYNVRFEEGVKDYFFLVTADGVSEAPDPTEGGGGIVIPTHDGVRVWVDDQTGWDAIALYQWGDVNNFGGDWPGAQVAGSETLGGIEYKYFEYGDDIYGLAQNLIFNNNNNGTQLSDYNLTFEEGVQDYFFQVTADGATLLDGPGGGSGGGGDTPEPPVEVEKDPVTIYVQDASGWENLYLYMWGDKELCGGWPGVAVTETEKIGSVTYRKVVVADAEGRAENLIFNNNDGTQTGNYEVTLAGELFVFLDAEAAVTPLDPRNPEIKILVNDKTDWEAITLYAWGDAEAFGGWPGATPVGTETVKGVEYTVFGLPADMAGKTLNLIFNNNGKGQQLADFAITVPEKELFLNINANYYVDNVSGNPRGDDSWIYVFDGMGWGENLHLYAWGGAEIFGGWPGAAGEAVGTFCGVPAYRFFVPAEHSGKEEHLIFNNGAGGDGNQFDGPAVNVGETLYYGISADFTWAAAEPTVRVYVEDNTGWEALYVYSWGTGEIFGGWPGAAVTGEQEIGGKTWKYVEIPASCFGWTANLIFNNNAGTQLENFDVLKGQVVGRDFFFTLTGDGVAVAE